MSQAKTTVRTAVIKVIQRYLKRKGDKSIPNWEIATAHKKHPLSGLQRFRELCSEGWITYEFDRKTNRYHVTVITNLDYAIREGK